MLCSINAADRRGFSQHIADQWKTPAQVLDKIYGTFAAVALDREEFDMCRREPGVWFTSFSLYSIGISERSCLYVLSLLFVPLSSSSYSIHLLTRSVVIITMKKFCFGSSIIIISSRSGLRNPLMSSLDFQMPLGYSMSGLDKLLCPDKLGPCKTSIHKREEPLLMVYQYSNSFFQVIRVIFCYIHDLFVNHL